MSDRPELTELTDRGDGGELVRCATCKSPRLAEVNADLRAKAQSNESFAAIARRYGLTESTVKRHFRDHSIAPPSPQKEVTELVQVVTGGPASEPGPKTIPSVVSNPPPLPVAALASTTNQPPPTTTPPPDPPPSSTTRQKEREGRKCVSCHHEKGDEINSALIQGTPLARIEKMFGISDTSLMRHRDNCLSEAARHARLTALDRIRFGTRDGMRAQIEAMVERLNTLITDVEADRKNEKADYRDVAVIYREMRGYLELLGKLLGHLGADIAIQVTGHPIVVALMQRVNGIVLHCPRCSALYEAELRSLEEHKAA